MPVESVISGGPGAAGVPVKASFGLLERPGEAGEGRPPCRGRAPEVTPERLEKGDTAGRTAVRWVDRVVLAQECLDGVIGSLERGRGLSSAGILRTQVLAYRATQELDLAGKLVEKAVGGLKQVLQAQV